jgi:FkbM family methyltransferase
VASHLLARRRLKALAARTLPEALKKQVRGLLYGYRKSRVSLPVAFASDPGGPAVVIDERIRLRFAEQDRLAIRTHLADHGAAVEEMSSFIDIAANANTFFDVGADRAIFSLVFCGSGAGKRAVAYEPSPGRFAAATELAALNGVDGRLTLRPAALGAIHGRASGTIFPDGTMVTDSHDPTGTGADVEMTTVDREVEALGLVPDVMKIDVEGYELEVLRGAHGLLRKRKPVLCLELHLDLLERRGIAPAELVANLQSYGYHFRSCVGRQLDPSDIADSMHAILRFVAF